MRFSVILSLLLAILLATGAVFGARNWLASERAQIMASVDQPRPREEAVEEKPKETIIVAREPIAFGERLFPNKLLEIEWSGTIRPEGAFSKIEEMILDDSEENARFALTGMTTGEPILLSKITAPGVRAKLSTALTPGLKAVSIRVNDVLGVAGFVLPGDRVDVMLTRDGYVDILLQAVKVLAIDQIADDRKDQPSVVRTVTFEVNTTEAQKLTLGSQVGMLSLALRNVVSTDVEPQNRVTLDDLSDFDVAEGLPLGESAEEEDKSGVLFEVTEPGGEEVLEPAFAPADLSDERLEELEVLLKGLAEDLSGRLDVMETKLGQPEPEVIRVPPPQPQISAKVGVIRNGQRVEYKVESVEQVPFGVTEQQQPPAE